MLLFPKRRHEGGRAAGAEGEFFDWGKMGNRRRHFRHRGSQAFAILLGGKGRHSEDGCAFGQAHGILGHTVLLEDGRQKPFLDVHHDQPGPGPLQADRLRLRLLLHVTRLPRTLGPGCRPYLPPPYHFFQRHICASQMQLRFRQWGKGA